jgi:hypothetical protein
VNEFADEAPMLPGFARGFGDSMLFRVENIMHPAQPVRVDSFHHSPFTMTMSATNRKTALREQIRVRVKSIAPAARAYASAELCTRLRAQKVWRAAKSILLFAPLPDEPDIWPLLAEALAANKIVALPSFVPGTNIYTARRIIDPARDLVIGKFGIR